MAGTSSAVSHNMSEKEGDAKRLTPEESELVFSSDPWSELVPFSVLWAYDEYYLHASCYYEADDNECRPVTLAAMGIGVPGFPENLHDLEDVKKAIGTNKGSLYSMDQVSTTSDRAKPFLLKEIIRRHIVTRTPLNVCPQNWTIGTCIKWLSDHPPPVDEHFIIKMCLGDLRTHIKNYHTDVAENGS